ncbi:ATP-binding cassette domain-containing protein [Streptomonospora litoralis]|uniref:Daunorubicin/doxorubicin resistance ATP-binding protein DrrA n=1 Tax=Streptomonospora litoralis TaxID=2498135 RepID=A0A4P6Q3B8_9ACTN|nr:ATP-binding cassette domain-containing protein [Streptomonospora litoralis]QBI55166.1 Daunorubicin/doxorubicin resistance ATP-binding protein DrrA [Streptomonospora litoralis]
MIHTRELARTFQVKGGTVEAVRGIDLDVEAGELIAFLGPNGAGKSTSLRMLTTLLLPTSGSATVAGFDVVADPHGVRRRIGYVGQGHSAGPGQRVAEELVNQGRLYGLGKDQAQARAAELLADLELQGLEKRETSRLSGGQQRRLDIAMGLIHRPELLFLDEPSTGLDPHSRANLWEHLARLREVYGTTILFSTHYLDEADTTAERVIVVDHGSIIADGTPDELKGKVSGDLVSLETASEQDARAAAQAVEAVSSAHSVDVAEATVRMRVDRGDAVLPEVLRALDARGQELRTVQVQRPSLDDVFLTLTGRSLREADR